MKKFVIASLPAEMYGQSPVKILREFMARKIVCYAISADELAEMNMRDSHACVSIPVQGLNELGYSTFECYSIDAWEGGQTDRFLVIREAC